MSLFERAAALEKENIAFAYCSVIEAKGSAPRHHANMIVLEDGCIYGTIGGGPVEYEVIKASQQALQSGLTQTVEYILNKDSELGLNMSCGGSMKIFIEIHGQKPLLLLLGGGHVNEAIAGIGYGCGYQVMVLDDKVKLAIDEKFPHVSFVDGPGSYEELVGRLPLIDWKNTFVVIATKDADQLALEAVLPKGPQYIGVIASKRKATTIREAIEVGNTELSQYLQSRKVHMPIGLDLGGETPVEIAVSVLAQIQKQRYHKTGADL